VFENPGELTDGDLELKLADFAHHPVHKVPTYHFRMVHAATREDRGSIRLSIGGTRHIEMYAGHIGYSVHEAHCGKRYAARAVRLLVPLAQRLGIDPLWITCDPQNVASRRTLERAGAAFVEIVTVPGDCIIAQSGHPEKCRYRLETSASPPFPRRRRSASSKRALSRCVTASSTGMLQP
jgi:tagatose 1,6-diphosphate aldolase